MSATRAYIILLLLLLIADATAKEDIIDSSIVQRQLENNSSDVNYRHYIIKGSLILSLPNMQLNKEIRFKDTLFDGPVDFSNIKFLQDVTFENVSFNRVNFHGANFGKDAIFSLSDFNNSADFSNSIFNKNASFDSSTFKGTADFTGSQIDGANFQSTRFITTCFFPNTIFVNASNFLGAHFITKAIFENAIFNDTLQMSDCTFGENAIFFNAVFNKEAKFVKASFLGDCTFAHAKLYGLAAFNYANFGKTTNFERSFFGQDANFLNAIFVKDSKFFRSNFSKNAVFQDSNFKEFANFKSSLFQRNASFEKAHFKEADFSRSQFMGYANFFDSNFDDEAIFEESKFYGVLNLDKAMYDKLYIRMSNINKLNFNETTYKSLIENFKKLGFLDDANNCYYRFMIEYGYEKLPGLNFIVMLNNEIIDSIKNLKYIPTTPLGGLFLSLYYLFSWTLYGFGTRPEFALIWSIILMVVVFGPFWWYVQRKSADKKGDEYSWDNYDHKTSMKSDLNFNFHEIINAILLSGSIFLSGTKFFIDPPDIPEALENVTPWVSRMFKLERFLGGVLSILFLIAIGSVVFSI